MVRSSHLHYIILFVGSICLCVFLSCALRSTLVIFLFFTFFIVFCMLVVVRSYFLCFFFFFFFFKQKTAYEMRISDWSSDVCSSDLDGLRVTELGQGRRGQSSIPGRRLHRRRQGVNLKATPDVAQFGRCGKSMEFRSLNRRLRLLPAAMLLAAILAPADAAAARLSTPDCDADRIPVALEVPDRKNVVWG